MGDRARYWIRFTVVIAGLILVCAMVWIGTFLMLIGLEGGAWD